VSDRSAAGGRRAARDPDIDSGVFDADYAKPIAKELY